MNFKHLDIFNVPKTSRYVLATTGQNWPLRSRALGQDHGG